jgi:hypothetical protein
MSSLLPSEESHKVLALICQLSASRIDVLTAALADSRCDTITFEKILIHAKGFFASLSEGSVVDGIVFNKIDFARHVLAEL